MKKYNWGFLTAFFLVAGACFQKDPIHSDSSPSAGTGATGAGTSGSSGTFSTGGAAGQGGLSGIGGAGESAGTNSEAGAGSGGDTGAGFGGDGGKAGSAGSSPWDIVVLNSKASPNMPHRIIVRDVDGDGKGEIFSGTVYYPGNPTKEPSFVEMWHGYDLTKPPTKIGNFLIGETIQEILSEDFDEDGSIDIFVISNSSPTYFHFLKGDGKGNFLPPISWKTSLTSEARAVTSDFDADGHLDIISSSLGGQTFFFRGDGKGSFVELGSLEIYPKFYQPLGLGMIPGTKTPVAVISDKTDSTTYFIGVSAGKPKVIMSSSWDGYSAFPVLRDMNKDGLNDLVSFRAPSLIMIKNGVENGKFPDNFEAIDLKNQVVRVAFSDFNNDGWPDIAAARSDQDQSVKVRADVTIAMRSSDGFSLEQILLNVQEAPAEEMVAGDVDGDGRPDLVVLTSKIRVFLNRTP